MNSAENLGIMDGAAHCIQPVTLPKEGDYSWMLKRYPGRIILTGKKQRPTMTQLSDVLKLMAQGYTLHEHKTQLVCWLQQGDIEGIYTNFVVEKNVIAHMQSRGYMELTGEDYKSNLYKLSQSGHNKHVNQQEESKSLVEKVDKPDPIVPGVPTPLLDNRARDVRTPGYQTSFTKAGKAWVATIVCDTPATLQRLKDFLQVPGLLQPTTPSNAKPIESAPTCFYCKEGPVEIRGRKPWRIHCLKTTCLKAFERDTKTKRQLSKSGLYVTV